MTHISRVPSLGAAALSQPLLQILSPSKGPFLPARWDVEYRGALRICPHVPGSCAFSSLSFCPSSGLTCMGRSH